MHMLPIILVIIFFIISLLHFYWVFGGKWGLDGSLPKNDEGENLFMPGPLSTMVVALGLLGFGLFYATRAGWLELPYTTRWSNIIGWMIPSIFLLRAIGDFRYCGLTKRVKGTQFAKMDSRYFTPLCLFIALLGYLSQL